MRSNKKAPKDIVDFFDKILDVFYDGIYISDFNGKTIKVSSMHEKITGLKKEELMGRLVTDLKKEGIFDEVLNPSIVEKGVPQTSIQISKAGRKVVLNGHPVFDEDGKVAYVVTFIRDITVLSQLKEQISSQAKLIERYHHEARYLRTKNLQDNNMIIKSSKMKKLLHLLEKISITDATALILGETGVGKDILAQKIHEKSPRRDEPFFKINCATIPENLIESELFGYNPGAFSGASVKGKPGYFELANNGTLFLDEIGELPLGMQAKLLRVLQDQEIMRIGSTKVKKINVRFIAATNRNLENAIQEGKFRSDLYYRLHVAVLDLPPLRERREEIIPLIDHFIEIYNLKYKKNISLTEESKQLLYGYKWPGNVREMENMIQGLIVTQDKEVLDVKDLPGYLLSKEGKDTSIISVVGNTGNKALKEIMDDVEKDLLQKALDRHCSVSKVANTFKMDRSTIFRKLKRHGLM